MAIIVYGKWRFRIDPSQTRLQYEAINGPTQTCKCPWCENFVAARAMVYPQDILDLLEGFGVDHTKEADVYQQHLDHKNRTVLYRWWFYFIGRIEEGPQAWLYEGFEPSDVLPVTFWNKQLETLRPAPQYFGIGFCDDPIRRQSEKFYVPSPLKPHALVQVEFNAEVPWLLESPMPKRL